MSEAEKRVRAAIADAVWQRGSTPDFYRDILDALDAREAENRELREAIQEAINTLGPDHFAGELVGLIAEGNEALRVLRHALSTPKDVKE